MDLKKELSRLKDLAQDQGDFISMDALSWLMDKLPRLTAHTSGPAGSIASQLSNALENHVECSDCGDELSPEDEVFCDKCAKVGY